MTVRIFGRRTARREQERERLRRERQQADQEAAREAARPLARALDVAATELLLGLDGALGRRFVGWVHRPWAEGRHLRALGPRPGVLVDALRRSGVEPPVPLLETYGAAEVALVGTSGWFRGLDDELAGAMRWVPGTVPAEEVPDTLVRHRCAAYDVAEDRLRRLSADLAAARGGGLGVDRALTSARWWPGRSTTERPVDDPLGLYGTFRSLEWRSDLGDDWWAPWAAASDLAGKGTGLPGFEPADWLLAAFRRTPVDAGGLGLSRAADAPPAG
ncbi:hypothetical protein ASG49_15575 [Marmoricola sp. Leaf446]|nr:hypothetical protein ASG49_15575 [Marmoricola sp. Leaf446]